MNASPSALSEKAARIAGNWRPYMLLAPLLAAITLGLTFAYWQSGKNEAALKRQRAFDAAAELTTQKIKRRLDSYAVLLRGVKGYFDSTGQLGRDGFHAYVEALQLEQNKPGLQGVALAVPVTQAQKTQHEAGMRQRGFPDYRMHPDGVRELYAPIALIEPYSGSNLKALGFDIMTVPQARRALAQARDSGDMAITEKIALVQDSGTNASTGLVLYLPIYRKGADIGTLAGRRAALMGWVDVPFRMKDLIDNLSSPSDNEVGLQIHDGELLSDATRLFGDSRVTGAAGGMKRLQTTRQIDIGGRHWTLTMYTLPAFDRQFDEGGFGLVSAIGTILSLMLGWLTWLLVTRRERALAMAREMTQELRDVRDDLQSTLSALPDMLFEVGLDGRFHKFMSSNRDATELPVTLFLGKLVSDIFPPEAARRYLAALQETNRHGYRANRQIELQIGQEHKWFEVSLARKTGVYADGPHFIGLARDITERKLAEVQLRLSAQVFDSSSEGIIITDAENRIVSVNRAWTEITGFSREEAIGQNPRVLQSGRQGSSFYAAMWQAIHADGHWRGELWNRRKNGEFYPAWLSISAIKSPQGDTLQYVGMLSDLTSIKAAHERIDHLAHHDPLTQLPNRTLLNDRAKLALVAAQRSATKVALLFIDLDRFQNVNDSLGHPVGDRVLQTLAVRLANQLHADDTVCHQGGDEFIMLLPDTSEQQAARIARRLLTLIAQPIMVDVHQLNLSASIGIAICPDNGADFAKLSQCAGAALSLAKQHGGDNFQFFTKPMHDRANESLLVESHLRRALQQGELRLHYQPQVDVASSRIVGAEALVRWQHPDWGLVMPGRFIAIAEASGQIRKIGDWVLHAATQQLAQWQAAGLAVVPVAVNLSALEFRQPTLCDTVADALRRSGVNARLLELELTEGIAMEDSEVTIERINKLRALGVTLAIDDFGTGYSSLSYLRRFKIDKLKIDQSFVSDLGRSQDGEAIVRAIIKLASGLGFRTIAEGVETQEQLDFLRAHGCNEVQGYFLSRPIPAAQFAELLRDGGPLPLQQQTLTAGT